MPKEMSKETLLAISNGLGLAGNARAVYFFGKLPETLGVGEDEWVAWIPGKPATYPFSQ